MLTQKRLKEVLHYNPTTGSFLRKSGSKAGPIPQGYVGEQIKISVDGRTYSARMLAWLYMTGNWPSGEIIQIDGMKHDNRFANLANITHKERFEKNIPYGASDKNYMFAKSKVISVAS